MERGGKQRNGVAIVERFGVGIAKKRTSLSWTAQRTDTDPQSKSCIFPTFLGSYQER